MSSYTPSADTVLVSGFSVTRNYGIAPVNNAPSIQSSAYPTLLRFDLSGIPSSGVALSASLKMTKASGVKTSSQQTISVYQIADDNGDWIEGTKNNATAGTGEPCWNKKKYNTVDWAGSVGMGTAGTDYINTLLASCSVNNSDAVGTVYTFDFNEAGLAVLQSWFGDATNNGLVLRYSAASSLLALKENTTESYRPVLTITYSVADTEDELASKDISSGVPAVAKATIGQKHALTADDVASGVPAVAKATIEDISSEDDLTAQNVAAGAPVVAQAAIGQKHALVSDSISTPAPVVDGASIGQVHNLTGIGVAGGVPVVTAPEVGQVHALTAQAIASGVPTLAEPTIGQTHALTAESVTSGAPEIESATVGQIHALVSNDITGGIAAVGDPTIGQVHALIANPVTTGTPALGEPVITQTHVLTAQDIESGTPTISKPTSGAEAVTVNLVAGNIIAGAPTVGSPTIAEVGKTPVETGTAAPFLYQQLFSRAKRIDEEELILLAMAELL